MSEWGKNGSVTLNVFGWLFEDWDAKHPSGLSLSVEVEFDPYNWHY